jgi:hypothetical protein
MSAVAAIPSRDDLMTAEREETKFLLPLGRVALMVNELDQELPSHRFTGEDANRLPDPHHYVTTVYFDTATRAQYRAAVTHVDRNVKVRGKEYYDVHPSLAEVATDPNALLHYQPWLWFELKRREGKKTFKHRVRLPKREVPQFFRNSMNAAVLRSAALDCDEQELPSDRSLALFEDFCRDLDEPLEASCIVNYRRLSWQSDDGALRVTLDLNLAFWKPPAELWVIEEPLTPSLLGPPSARLDRAVLEVKSRAEPPAWLERALGQSAADPSRFSKFVAAARAVHGNA